LFLDVVIPQKVFNKKFGSGAPVIVWIYGGGFTLGDKASSLSSGNPATLVSRSLDNGGEGVIYVAMNYRLGLFVCILF
jgi:carboxylesterase type B